MKENTTKLVIVLVVLLVSIVFFNLRDSGVSDLTGQAVAKWACLDDINRGYLYSDGGWFPGHTTQQNARKWPCNLGRICEDGRCVSSECPVDWNPVCGTDGNTYTNSCIVQKANVQIAYNGICLICPAVVDPVCGVDGITYNNECEAKKASVKVVYNGACQTCVEKWRCVDGIYRAFQYTDCTWYPDHTTQESASKYVQCDSGKVCQDTSDSVVCVPQGTVSTTISVQRGFNLVSVPLITEDMRPGVVFPDVVSLFAVYPNGTYFRPATLEIGRGYLAVFNDARDYTITGVKEDVLYKINNEIWPTLPNGWTLIGPGFGMNLPLNSLPTNLGVFSWSGGRYVQITSGLLENGKSYWINKGGGGVVPASPFDCTSGWYCYNDEVRSYRDNLCQWSSMTYCPNGCNGGECLWYQVLT